MNNLVKVFSFFLLAIQFCFAQTIQHQHYSTAMNETSLKSNKLQNQSEFYEVDSQKGPVEEVWVRHYGSGIAPSIERAIALQTDKSGNIYVTGFSGMGETDYVTIKYNSPGEVLWVARYNGDGNGSDRPKALTVDAMGNVYVTGGSPGFEGVSGYEYATIKYSPEGNELWVAHYNAQGNPYNQPVDIAVDSFGNVYVTGRSAISYDRFATIKYNKDGEEQWVATYNNSSPTAMTIDDMGNVYVTGMSEGNDIYHSYDYATIKYSTEGKQLWISRYNSPSNYYDIPTDIAVDKLGHVYVTGESDSANDSRRYTTIKYNAGGGQEWIRRYNTSKSNRDEPSAIAIDSSGNIIVTGTSLDPFGGSNYDYLTIKYNPNGVEQWVSRYNGPGNSYDEASSLSVDIEGNIYVTGVSSDTSGSYIATVNYSPSGEEKWISRYKGEGTAIAVDPLGNVLVTGSCAGKDDYADYCTIKYNPTGIMQWIEFYNGPGTSSDRPKALTIDTLGNIYVTGSSLSSNGYDDYATIKYNAVGQTEWITRYNGPKNLNDRPVAITVDKLGNVYVTGCSDSFYIGGWFSRQLTDYTTVKYNSSGVEEWVAQYDGSGNGNDVAAAIAVDIAGNVYVTGSSFSSDSTYDITTIKYNPGGDEQWDAHYKGSVDGYASAKSMAVDDSGNVYLTGTISDNSSSIITIKYNTNGIEQWISQYKGEEGSSNVACDMKIDNLGNVYVTGESWDVSSGEWDVYTTIKYKNDGLQQWAATYEDSAGDYGSPSALAVDNYGNVYVTGSRRAKGSSDGNYVSLKYNTEGILQWTSVYKGMGDGLDDPSAIAVDRSGNVYVTGQSEDVNNSHCYATVKYNTSGMEEWVALHSGWIDYYYSANLAIDASGYVYVTGSSNFPTNTNNNIYTTIKYVQTPMSVKDKPETVPEKFQLQQNYPNPFNPTTIIKYSISNRSFVTLKVFDILGREIETLINQEKTAGIYEIEFNASYLPSGVYFYQLRAGDFIQTKKMILMK